MAAVTNVSKNGKKETSTLEDPQRQQHREYQWARRLALQALYQWDVSRTDSKTLLEQFLNKEEMDRADAKYFSQLLLGVVKYDLELTRRLQPILDREMDRLDPVERTVLRFSSFELLHCPQMPTAVVLSEGVRLAAKFGTEKGSKYVNAILDRAAREFRSAPSP